MLERLRPHRIARCLAELTCEEFIAQGIRGIILDLDNTLTPWRSLQVTSEVAAWIDNARRAKLAVCVVSNAATARRVRPVADQLGIPWVTRAGKPLARGFQRGMRLMGTDPSTTAIIGDQLFTDILGGNSLGLYTVLVDPISTNEAVTTKWLQRPLERLVGRIPKEHPPTPPVRP